MHEDMEDVLTHSGKVGNSSKLTKSYTDVRRGELDWKLIIGST